jgi:hypothetical protein
MSADKDSEALEWWLSRRADDETGANPPVPYGSARHARSCLACGNTHAPAVLLTGLRRVPLERARGQAVSIDRTNTGPDYRQRVVTEVCV